jgi:glycosyltransferase involved in cell wall biosynthesis
MINIVVLGISCIEGMAGTRRVRNLVDPLISKRFVSVSNLIYENHLINQSKKDGFKYGIKYKAIGFSLINILSLFRFYYNGCEFLSRAKSKHERNVLYHYDSPDVKSILFVLYAKLIGYKVIFDIIEDHRFAPAYKGVLYKFRVSTSVFLLNKIQYLADGVVVISEHLHQRMIKICKNRIPLRLIPISVNLTNFSAVPKQVCSRDLKIFYGGSFGEKDGLEFLIKAFDQVCSKYKNTRLILTGMGNDLQQKKIKDLLGNINYAHKISYKGYLSVNEYYDVLNECDIFCVTRVNSSFANAGFPFKLGEFLAVGKAVIATNVGGVSQYLKDGINALIVQPESTMELVQALTTVIENPDRISAIGVEGRKTAVRYFDSEMLSSQLHRFMEEV